MPEFMGSYAKGDLVRGVHAHSSCNYLELPDHTQPNAVGSCSHSMMAIMAPYR